MRSRVGLGTGPPEMKGAFMTGRSVIILVDRCPLVKDEEISMRTAVDDVPVASSPDLEGGPVRSCVPSVAQAEEGPYLKDFLTPHGAVPYPIKRPQWTDSDFKEDDGSARSGRGRHRFSKPGGRGGELDRGMADRPKGG